MRTRPQFAPNDPYFSTVGGQPSVPWPDDSHTHRCTRAVTQVGVVLHNVWHSISHESAHPHVMRAVAVSHAPACRACRCSESRIRIPCVPLQWVSAPAYRACRCSESSTRMPCVPLQWVTHPHTMRAVAVSQPPSCLATIAVSQRARMPCVPLHVSSTRRTT